MKLRMETTAALETLYCRGDSTPVCAVTPDFRLLWQNCAQAEALLTVLCMSLRSSIGTDQPLIPADGQLHISAEGVPYCCRVQRMMDGDSPFFVVVFEKLTGLRRMTAPEMRQLLTEYDRVCERAVGRVLAAMQGNPGDLQPDEAIRHACCEIFGLSQRSAQLLWYESVTEELLQMLEPVEVSGLAGRVANALEAAAGGVFTVRYQAEGTGYARVDPNQLSAALMSLFLTVQRGDPDKTDITVAFAERSGRLTLSVTARKGKPAGDALLPYCPDGTLISEDVLLTRFCSTFGAELTAEKSAEAVCHMLTLPAVPREDVPLELHAPDCEFALPDLVLLTRGRMLLSPILRIIPAE